MAEGGEPHLTTCGRHGCANVERGSEEFLRCSRCKATFYCSRECQKEDYCKGHSACALKGLQAAAEDGPLTTGACKQVVRILANNRTNPELLASTAATITRALQHHTFEAPPTALLKAGLLPALASVVASLLGAPLSSPTFSLHLAAEVDTVAAVFNALLMPCVLHFLNHHFANVVLQPGRQPCDAESTYAPWRPVYACLMQPSLAPYLICAAFCDSHAGSHMGMPVPGTEALKLIGVMRQLTKVYESDNYHYTTYIDGSSVERVLAMYKREMQSGNILLKCCLVQHLSDMVHDSKGKACQDLLRLPHALPLLAQGLESPATHSTEVQLHPSIAYLQHITMLDQLSTWTASVIGIQGLQQVAQALARPMIAAVDYVLSPSAGGLPPSSWLGLHVGVLRSMCHMAATPAGRSCIAAAGCLPQWLCHSRGWQASPLLLLMVALSCMTDWTCTIYWKKLYKSTGLLEAAHLSVDGMDIEAYRKSCPPLLRQQVASQGVVDSLAGLLKTAESCWTKALLVDLLLKACSTRPALTPAAVEALLHAAARAPGESTHPDDDVPPLQYPSFHPDLVAIRALKGVLKHRINHGTYAAASAEAQVPALVGAWLEHFAPSSSADALPPSCNDTALLLHLQWIGHAARSGILPPFFLAAIHFFERMIPLLRLTTNPDVFIATTMCLYEVMVTSSIRAELSECATNKRLVTRPTYLTRLLEFARAWAAGEPEQAIKRVSVVYPLLMVVVAATSWRPAEERVAHEQLLGASWVWDLLRLAVEGGAGEHDAMLCGLGMYLAKLARSPGSLKPMLHGALQRVGQASALQLAGCLPDDSSAWATAALRQQFAEVASATQGRGCKMSQGAPVHGGQPCDAVGHSGDGPKRAGSIMDTASNHSGSSSSSGSSKSSNRARAADSSSSSKNSSSRRRRRRSSSSYLNTTADPSLPGNKIPCTLPSSASKASSRQAQPAMLADALPSLPKPIAAATSATSAAAAAAAGKPVAPTAFGGTEVALLQRPEGVPLPSSVTCRTLPLPPSTLEHFRTDLMDVLDRIATQVTTVQYSSAQSYLEQVLGGEDDTEDDDPDLPVFSLGVAEPRTVIQSDPMDTSADAHQVVSGETLHQPDATPEQDASIATCDEAGIAGGASASDLLAQGLDELILDDAGNSDIILPNSHAILQAMPRNTQKATLGAVKKYQAWQMQQLSDDTPLQDLATDTMASRLEAFFAQVTLSSDSSKLYARNGYVALFSSIDRLAGVCQEMEDHDRPARRQQTQAQHAHRRLLHAPATGRG